jgi:hypothetical protein
MNCPLLPLAYLPPLAWCAAAWQAPVAVLELSEHYQKGSLRNRCHIAGPNGVQRLSIPLQKGKHQQLPLREVRIAYDEPWQRQHWRSICTAYGNAPYFEHYEAELRPFFEQRHTFLFEYNLAWLDYLFGQKWAWQGRFQHSDTYVKLSAWPQGPDLRNAFPAEPTPLPEWYLPRPYPQVFAERWGFLPNLSALDLLMCCGKRGGEWLEKQAP